MPFSNRPLLAFLRTEASLPGRFTEGTMTDGYFPYPVERNASSKLKYPCLLLPDLRGNFVNLSKKQYVSTISTVLCRDIYCKYYLPCPVQERLPNTCRITTIGYFRLDWINIYFYSVCIYTYICFCQSMFKNSATDHRHSSNTDVIVRLCCTSVPVYQYTNSMIADSFNSRLQHTL